MPAYSESTYLIASACRFDVLDSLNAPANAFLLHRDTSQLASSLSALNVPQPGEANRWSIGKEDLRGLVDMERLQTDLEYMSDIRVSQGCSCRLFAYFAWKECRLVCAGNCCMSAHIKHVACSLVIDVPCPCHTQSTVI